MATTRAILRPADQPASRSSAYRDGAYDGAGHAFGSSLRPDSHLATILVVDDDPITALILCEMLREARFRAVGAVSFWDALRRVENENFDLVITEAKLAEEFSGAELVIYARSINPALKSLFISRHGPVIDDPEQDDFVAKPFHRRELLGCVFELLYRRFPAIRQKCRSVELAQIEAKIAALRPSSGRRSPKRTDVRRAESFSLPPLSAQRNNDYAAANTPASRSPAISAWL